MTQAAILIQSKFRSYWEQKKFQQSRRAAVLIQQCYRSYRADAPTRSPRPPVPHRLRYCLLGDGHLVLCGFGGGSPDTWILSGSGEWEQGVGVGGLDVWVVCGSQGWEQGAQTPGFYLGLGVESREPRHLDSLPVVGGFWGEPLGFSLGSGRGVGLGIWTPGFSRRGGGWWGDWGHWEPRHLGSFPAPRSLGPPAGARS